MQLLVLKHNLDELVVLIEEYVDGMLQVMSVGLHVLAYPDLGCTIFAEILHHRRVLVCYREFIILLYVPSQIRSSLNSWQSLLLGHIIISILLNTQATHVLTLVLH